MGGKYELFHKREKRGGRREKERGERRKS